MLELLVSVKGQKLVWVGFDPETEGFYLTFEDKTTVLIQATKVEKFFEGGAEALLAEALPAAKQIVELDKLIRSTAPDAPSAAEATA